MHPSRRGPRSPSRRAFCGARPVGPPCARAHAAPSGGSGRGSRGWEGAAGCPPPPGLAGRGRPRGLRREPRLKAGGAGGEETSEEGYERTFPAFIMGSSALLRALQRPWAHSALPGPKPTASTPCGARRHDRAGGLAYLCQCPLSRLLLNFPRLLSYPVIS
ncbi:collagen alpha-1(I) chain-like [Ursus maritimus]|uniref:Collagen alpha-1(I) chain-like n=1 Tax=Ursus maritimus TaxID=29073 RepID=A0A8M1G7B9_URSMA|nr:collagen alpha-1(I) chain-like [Ursus maritimus]